MALDIYYRQIVSIDENTPYVETLSLNLESKHDIQVYEMAKELEIETGKPYLIDDTSVRVKTIDYQRGCLKENHCFYGLYGSPEYAVVFSNDVLNAMLDEFEADAIIQTWELDNDKFCFPINFLINYKSTR